MASGAQDGARGRARVREEDTDDLVIQESRGVCAQIEKLDHALSRAEKAFDEHRSTIFPILLPDDGMVPGGDAVPARLSRSNVTDMLASMTDRMENLGHLIRRATSEVDL